MLSLGLILTVLAALGAVQWRARDAFLKRGWTVEYPERVPDTPGYHSDALSRACVNASLESYSLETLPWALDAIRDGGFGWVRQRISWAAVEPERGVQDWAAVDAIVEGTLARGLGLVAVLDDAPAWAGGPPDPQAYARWAGAVAARYGDQLTYYQIWHNPNLGEAWGGTADAYAYTTLLTRAAEAIRAADAGARIVLGSLAPTIERGGSNFAESLFLDMLYDAGAGPAFDVVAVQPYGFHTGPDDRRVADDVLNFSRAILVREALVAHGESDKAVWASAFGWNSKPTSWPGPESIWGTVDEITQARYSVEALERVEREWPWMGLMCLNGLQPRPETQVDNVAESGTPDALEHWGFALVTPGHDGRTGPGVPRPIYEAVRKWALTSQPAVSGAYRADTELATYEGLWTLGPQGADIGQSGDRVTFTFDGTDVALTVRRGPYRAFLFVTVDDLPAPALPRDREGNAYVVLYDPLSAVATVPLAEGLPEGTHTVEVVAERGWGQWALADWRVVSRPDPAGARGWGYMAFLAIGLVGSLAVAISAPRANFGSVGESLARARRRVAEWLQLAIAATVTAVTLFASWQVLTGNSLFRRLGDHGELAALALSAGLFYFSPWLLVALGAGLVMAVLVFLRPELGLALTVVAAPLYLHPLSLFGKSFSLAELVLLPTIVGWALQGLAGARQHKGMAVGNGDLGRIMRRLLAPVVLFMVLSAVSAVAAEHLREAMRELRLIVIEPVLLLWICITLPMDRRARLRILDAWVISGLMVALVGLVQFLVLGDAITAEGGVQRLRSIYGSPNNVGLYLGRLVPLVSAVVLWAGPAKANSVTRTGPRTTMVLDWLATLLRDRRRLAYLVALPPLVAALALSLSRGAIVLGIPAALLTMGWLAGKRWRTLTLVVLAIGLVALVPLLRTPRFSGMLDPTQGTTGFRVALWYSTLELVREHPLLGVGLDNFLYAFRTRYVLPTAWEEFNLSHPHNIALDFAARLGLPGLACLVWMQVAFWRTVAWVRRRRRPDAGLGRALLIGIAGSMADFLAHGLVDAAYFVIDLAFVHMVTWAVLAWLAAGWPED